jgi:imidazolonepropionase
MEPFLYDGLDHGTGDFEGLESLGALKDGVIAISEGKIVFTGKTEDFTNKYGPAESFHVIDAGHDLIMPGMIDSHTHMAFSGSRQKEFLLRIKGAGYMEIHNAGGGILSTLESVRSTSVSQMAELIIKRLDRSLSLGITSCEIKSGYALDTEKELDMLRAIDIASRNHACDVVPTYMGAHAVPPEFKGRPDEYIDRIIKHDMPAAASLGLARYCDVFCEKGVFSVDQTRRILMAARGLGLGLKLHADEIVSLGGAELAAEVSADSAEHLIAASDRGIKMMAQAGVTAVLLPTTPLFLMKSSYAPALKMIDLGVNVALATDFNPGSSTNQSLFLSMSIACLNMKMTPAQALRGVTVNAAKAIGLDQRAGSLKPGMDADILVLNAPDHLYIPYNLNGPQVLGVYKKGVKVF